MKLTVWIEVEPDWIGYDHRVGRTRTRSIKAGRMWKTRPKVDQPRPGALAIEVTVDVPEDRMENVVEAFAPTAPPVTVA